MTVVALDAYEAFRAGSRASPLVSSKEVRDCYLEAAANAGYNVKRENLRPKIPAAFEQLALLAPERWMKVTLGSGKQLFGRRHDIRHSVDACADANGSIESVRGNQHAWRTPKTDVVFGVVRELVADADPPFCTTSDLTLVRLSSAAGYTITSKRWATPSVESLCRSTKNDRRLINLGVVEHKRYLTVPANASVARAAFAVVHAKRRLKKVGAEIRAATRITLGEERVGRLARLRAELEGCEAELDIATRSLARSPWLRAHLPAVVSHVRRYQERLEMLAGTPKASASTPLPTRVVVIPYAGIVEEAHAAVLRWGYGYSAETLARRARKRCTRFDPWRGTERQSLAIGGLYPTFQVRALLLSWVADKASRRFASSALRWLGPTPTLSALIAAITHTEARSRMASSLGLAFIGGTDAVRALETAAHDPEPGVCECALWSLSLVAPSRAELIMGNGNIALDEAGQLGVRRWLDKAREKGAVAWATSTGRGGDVELT